MVFLEIPNVPLGMVFAETVTIFPHLIYFLEKSLALATGVSNHWNGIRTGLDWNGMERYGIAK